jgi:MFS family permease
MNQAKALELAPKGSRLAPLEVRGKDKLKHLNLKPDVDWSKRRYIFLLFASMNLLLNYDTGVIPASLIQIKREVNMSFQEQAALGSLVYLGLSSASLIVSTVFQQFSAARTIVLMLVLNVGFCLMFSFSFNLYLMYVARIGMGFTQAFCVIYGPVWINEFSPPQSTTRWMGLLQAAVPLGIMLGYTVSGTIINFFSDYISWRFSIQLQAFLELPIIICLAFADHSEIDITESVHKTSLAKVSLNKQVRIDSINIGELASFWEQVKMLLSSQIFIWVSLALCSLYFVVSGIQYWITIYLIEVLGSDPVLVLCSFGITCITGPLVGVLVGSYISDNMGGYKGENLLVALKLCAVFAVMACVFAIPIGFVGSLVFVTPLLWALLFFGGAMIPTATGINVNTVSREYQSTSSSISQLVFNLGGYFLSPILSAFVMDQFDDPIEGLRWGVRFILMASVVGLLCISCAVVYAYYRRRKGTYTDFDEERDVVGDLAWSAEEANLEVLRQRAHSLSI